MDRIDPVKKVFTELFVGHHLLQIPVGCTDQPHIDRNRTVASYLYDRATLDRRQQLSLKMIGQISYFIQKERSALCHLEFTNPVEMGIGEGSLDVAEQLAFEQCLSQCAHIDRDHQLAGP